MIYRKAEITDLVDIVNIHESSFKDFFLTTLGNSFLRVYYETCIKYEDSIVICAVDEDGCICGFASGTIRSNRYYTKIFLFNLAPFIVEVIKLLFKRPLAIIRLALNLDKSKSVLDEKNYAELLSLAVKPEMKGSGLGMSLLGHFERVVIFQGTKVLTLTTDCENNDRVVSFYKKCGYDIFYTFLAYPNRKMHKLIKKLD